MNQPIEYYKLKRDTLYQLCDGYWIVLLAGERCGYFGHSDTYLFGARRNEVPFFTRSTVERLTDWFEPVIPYQGEPSKPRILTESDEYF